MKKTRKALSALLAAVLAALLLFSIAAPAAAADPALQKEWDQLKKNLAVEPVMKSKNYENKELVKGTKIIYTCPMYTFTFLVTRVENVTYEKRISYKATVKSKYEGFNLGFDMYRDLSDDAKTQTGMIYVYENESDTLKFEVYGSEFRSWAYERYRGNVDDFDEDAVDKWVDREYSVEYRDSTPTPFSRTYVTADYQSVTVDKAASSYPFDVLYRESGASKWSKVAYKEKGTAVKIGKLKANTVYQVKIRPFEFFYRYTADETKSYFNDSKPVKIRTGVKDKPVVTSVKVSNVKHITEHHDGYWRFNTNKPATWVPARDEKVTTYQVTVTVKALPKGAVGIYAGGQTAKGKTTITFKSSCAGHVNKVSGSTKVCFYMEDRGKNTYGYKTISGTSPKVKVNYSN